MNKAMIVMVVSLYIVVMLLVYDNGMQWEAIEDMAEHIVQAHKKIEGE